MNDTDTRPCYFLDLRHCSTVNPGRRVEGYCIHLPFEVKYGNDVVAFGHACLLHFGLGERRGFGPAQIISCVGEYADELYPALFDQTTGRIRSDLVKTTDRRDVLYIDCIKLVASQRGRGIGSWIVGWLIDMFGSGYAAVVLEVRPLDSYDASKPDSTVNNGWFCDPLDREVYATPFEAKGDEAKAKLRAHFAPMGFKRIGTTDFMICDMADWR